MLARVFKSAFFFKGGAGLRKMLQKPPKTPNRASKNLKTVTNFLAGGKKQTKKHPSSSRSEGGGGESFPFAPRTRLSERRVGRAPAPRQIA